jgi:hypothetical protein
MLAIKEDMANFTTMFLTHQGHLFLKIRENENEILRKHKGPCGPFAVSRSLNLNLSDCILLCKHFGSYNQFGRRRGMTSIGMTSVLKNICPEAVMTFFQKNPNHKPQKKTVRHFCKFMDVPEVLSSGEFCPHCGRDVWPRLINERPTLTKFCLQHPEGKYIVSVNRHFLTVVDGKIQDELKHRVNRTVDKRKVIESWEISKS